MSWPVGTGVTRRRVDDDLLGQSTVGRRAEDRVTGRDLAHPVGDLEDRPRELATGHVGRVDLGPVPPSHDQQIREVQCRVGDSDPHRARTQRWPLDLPDHDGLGASQLRHDSRAHV
ncbi:hypothetical protein LP422_22125 [Janibacter limosus]|nr:hypothetical protein LP422_22125 [Janibacter limosus]